MDCATIRSDVIGDFQEPYGAVLVKGDDMAALTSNHLRKRRASALWRCLHQRVRSSSVVFRSQNGSGACRAGKISSTPSGCRAGRTIAACYERALNSHAAAALQTTHRAADDSIALKPDRFDGMRGDRHHGKRG